MVDVEVDVAVGGGFEGEYVVAARGVEGVFGFTNDASAEGGPINCGGAKAIPG